MGRGGCARPALKDSNGTLADAVNLAHYGTTCPEKSIRFTGRLAASGPRVGPIGFPP